MTTPFMEQVQLLMQTQHIRLMGTVMYGRTGYKWLCSKRTHLVWLSPKDEFQLRQALNKVSDNQKIGVIKRLIVWLEEHPEAMYSEIPDICQKFLNQVATLNLINEVNFTRMDSFRNSFRRFSRLGSNRIKPESDMTQNKRIKSVTFKEKPILYQIPTN